jgi:hypothetical protein
MLARQPGQNSWPETNKAAVLASAYHAVGSTDQPGVGAVVTYRNFRFIDECNSTCHPLGTADFDANGNHDHVVGLTKNQQVKVAIAWDPDSNPSGGTDVIGADIDLSALSSTNVQNVWLLQREPH